MGKKTKWLFKAKSPYIKPHKDFKPCTVEEKKRLEKQYPNHFIFKENKPPEMTPSMKSEE
jgi:hypothetical protein